MGQGHRLGAWGEDLAAAFLARCGYRVLARNYRIPGGEIDLVVTRDGLVAFVEVKTRGPGTLDDPAAWVDGRKLRRLRRAAGRWLAEHPGMAKAGCRFDVVAIRWEGRDRGASLTHLAHVA